MTQTTTTITSQWNENDDICKVFYWNITSTSSPEYQQFEQNLRDYDELFNSTVTDTSAAMLPAFQSNIVEDE